MYADSVDVMKGGPKVEESEITGTKYKSFFYRDENRNSLILPGRKDVLTL